MDTKLFGKIVLSCVCATQVAFGAQCNEGIDYATFKVHLMLKEKAASNSNPENGGARVYYKPVNAQTIREDLFNQIITFPYFSYGERYWGNKKEIGYFNGTVHTDGMTAGFTSKNQLQNKMNPVSYKIDLNQLSGKSNQLGEASWENGFYLAPSALFNTGTKMAINLVFDNVNSYCSDASGTCKLKVYIPKMYAYDYSKYDGKVMNWLCFSKGAKNAISNAKFTASLEPTTDPNDACSHQKRSSQSLHNDYAMFELQFNKSASSATYAFVFESNSANGTMASPKELIEDKNAACGYVEDPNPTPPPPEAVIQKIRLNFGDKIIERLSYDFVAFYQYQRYGRENFNFVFANNNRPVSISFKDKKGKDVAWSGKIAWSAHVFDPRYGKCPQSDFITDEFDSRKAGTSTMDLRNSNVRKVISALVGRDLHNVNNITAAPNARADSSLRSYGDELVRKAISCGVQVHERPNDMDSAVWQPAALVVYDFKIHNVEGVDYDNLVATVKEEGETHTVNFKARPDRIVVNDSQENPNLKNQSGVEFYRDCASKDCVVFDESPVAGLAYQIDKSKNEGYQKANPINLAHNFLAVDADGKVVKGYNRTVDATIMSGVQDLGIKDVKAKVEFKNGIGYLYTGSDKNGKVFKYDYSAPTFIKIIDDTLGKISTPGCKKGQFHNTTHLKSKFTGRLDKSNMNVPVWQGEIGCDLVLIEKPKSLSADDRVITYPKAYLGNELYGSYASSTLTEEYANLPQEFYTQGYTNTKSDEMSGDFWYNFAPAKFEVSHTAKDYFANMTYYDNLDKNNSIYARLDLDMTAYNGDSAKTVAKAYTSGDLKPIYQRSYKAPIRGFANDMNLSLKLTNVDVSGIKLTLNTQDASLFKTEGNSTIILTTAKEANFSILRDAFKDGKVLVSTGANFGRDPKDPINPKPVAGSDFGFGFKEHITNESLVKLPSDSGVIIDPVTQKPVTSKPVGKATFFYGRLFVPKISETVKDTPFEFKSNSYYAVYCSLANCDKLYPLVVSKAQPPRAANNYFVNLDYANQASVLNSVYGFEIVKSGLDINGGVGLKIEDYPYSVQNLTYTKDFSQVPFSPQQDVYNLKATPLLNGEPTDVLISSEDFTNIPGSSGVPPTDPFVPFIVELSKTAPKAATWHGAGDEGEVLGFESNKTSTGKRRISY